MAKKINKRNLLIVLGVLFALSVLPGQGTKAADTQAIVTTQYTCDTAADCPTCVGAGLETFNASDPTFLGELEFAACVDDPNSNFKVCELSDACLVWDCADSQVLDNGTLQPCESVKQTVLDNTIGKFNENPILLIGMVGLAVAFILL